MEEQELERYECADCGELVSDEAPHFELGGETELVLCFECAVRRGGQYDASRDEWVKFPDLRAVPGANSEQRHGLSR